MWWVDTYDDPTNRNSRGSVRPALHKRGTHSTEIEIGDEMHIEEKKTIVLTQEDIRIAVLNYLNHDHDMELSWDGEVTTVTLRPDEIVVTTTNVEDKVS